MHEHSPQSTQQRCTSHRTMNVLYKLPTNERPGNTRQLLVIWQADSEQVARKLCGDEILWGFSERAACGWRYHDMNAREVAVGFVFTGSGDWTVTLSHEVLELIVDPSVNIFLPGPDPRDPNNANKWLLHSYETCYAVERTSYTIDGVRVSSFVTPSYFRCGDVRRTQLHDFKSLVQRRLSFDVSVLATMSYQWNRGMLITGPLPCDRHPDRIRNSLGKKHLQLRAVQELGALSG